MSGHSASEKASEEDIFLNGRREVVNLPLENRSGPTSAFELYELVSVINRLYTASESQPPLRRYKPDTTTKIIVKVSHFNSLDSCL